jgi:hypothetical protein
MEVIFLKALEVPAAGGGAPYYQRVTVLLPPWATSAVMRS